MDTHIERALERSQLVDITTIGRTTGRPRRIEIVLHRFDEGLFISGMPNPRRRRAWLRNLEADERFTLHLKQGIRADLPARARVIVEPEERRRVLEKVARAWQRTDVEAMVAWSPLIEVLVDDPARSTDAA